MHVRARWWLLVLVVLLVATACGSGPGDGEGSGETRRVLVDYKHDEIPASFNAYFPNLVKVHPGDRVDFKQAWTGEPHSVTMGRLVDELGEPFWRLLDPILERGDADYSSLIGVDAPQLEAFSARLPRLADAELNVLQAVSQPCYIRDGAPDASDPDAPCEVQDQPDFDGRYDYYNSGFIPFEGDRGNTFTVPLADDIPPGTYHYYCNWHSLEMSGAIEVVPAGEPIPSQTDVNKAANVQATRYTDELETFFDDARAGRRGDLPVIGVGATARENAEKYGQFAAIGNAFIPSTIEADVEEEVTWTFVDRAHSIAFNVPKYFPVFGVADDGTVTIDERAFRAIEFPAPPAERARPPGSRAPVDLDGGRFDGSGGLHSSGMFHVAGDTLTVRFSRPGTYLFACLVHPPMVGEVVVR